MKFRRSATLTGSLSDDVRASVEERGQLQTARTEAQAKRKKRRSSLRRVSFVCLVIVGLFAAYMHYTSGFNFSFSGSLAKVPSTSPYNESGKQFAASSLRNQFGVTMDRQKFAQYILERHK